jgi:hypothetical protein
MCSNPVPAQDMVERGVCVMCADKIEVARALVPSVVGGEPIPRNSQFNRVLAELKEATSPATIGLSEALLEKSGGAEKLGEMLWEDLKAVRGDNLSPEMRSFHITDHKVLRGYHQLIHALLKDRDALIKDVKDPLESLDEQDLLVVVSEAAKTRVSVDEDFRREIVAIINEIDPKLIESYYMAQHGLPVLM